jgi:hypothetical protein
MRGWTMVNGEGVVVAEVPGASDGELILEDGIKSLYGGRWSSPTRVHRGREDCVRSEHGGRQRGAAASRD